MSRKAIKIIVLITVLALLIGGGIWAFLSFRPKGIVGSIEFGKKYQLTELRENALFTGAEVNTESYFTINKDQRTGELKLIGLDVEILRFIVTNYQETPSNTRIDIEFIYQNKIQKLTAYSNNDEIRFKMIQSHRVDVTQENPDAELHDLQYEATIMVFTREVTE